MNIEENLEKLLRPLKDTAVETARLLKNLGARVDAFSMELARDVGAVARDAQALRNAAVRSARASCRPGGTSAARRWASESRDWIWIMRSPWHADGSESACPATCSGRSGPVARLRAGDRWRTHCPPSVEASLRRRSVDAPPRQKQSTHARGLRQTVNSELLVGNFLRRSIRYSRRRTRPARRLPCRWSWR